MKSIQSEMAGLPLEALDASEPYRQIASHHPLWRHPFVERCRAGELTLEQVRVLACQMYKFCHSFPRYLATALTLCTDEDTRMVIAENLWDELGEGDPARAHAALLRRFTRSLDITDAQLDEVPTLPETAALIDTYLGLAARHGLAGILGALCFASEGIVAALYTTLQDGVLRSGAVDAQALEFFTVHIHVDGGHADKLEAVLLPLLESRPAVAHARQAIELALAARCRFFDGVLRAASAPSGPRAA
jgi:pyrroloquinoline-quinone synthase